MSNATHHNLIDDKIKQMLGEIEFIRLREVRRLTGLSTSTIYRMSVNRTFPKQVKLGIKAVAWVKVEVLEWCLGRVARSRAYATLPSLSDKQQTSNQG